jgi:RNA polymerase-binding transcription factor DksA
MKGLKVDLERQLARLLQSARVNSPDDSATYHGPNNVESALNGRRQEQLSVITAALQRLDTGEYGDCVSCGNPIPYGRLAVMPETTLCIACGAR